MEQSPADYLIAMGKRLRTDKSNLRWMANNLDEQMLFEVANLLNEAIVHLDKAVLEISAEKS